MKYYKKCLIPDSKSGLTFNDSGVFADCINYDNQKLIDWDQCWKELEHLCDKYREKMVQVMTVLLQYLKEKILIFKHIL